MRRLRPVALPFLLTGLIGFNLACSERPSQSDTRPADERAIRDAVVEWSKAAGAKDVEKTLSFYAEDASVLPAHAPIATGKDQIRKFWAALMASPGYALGWSATKVEASKSGDVAYEVGTYELTLNDPKGKPAMGRGKYVVVWKKQADGAWKAAEDIFNPDQ